MKYILINIFTLLCLAASMQSCKDDLYFDEPGPFPEGETTLKATVSFRPFDEGLTDSRSAGDALKFINDLAIVVFDYEGNFIKCQDITESTTGTVAGNENETNVAKKTFNLTLPFGAYKIFAVGNIPNFTATYGKQIESIEDLQNIRLTWKPIDDESSPETNTAKMKENAQMFGYF
ncbi:MAG: FimB/Mfa2 family fimbrial subunit, partial [Paramuribaculum sp.]|nr:FimB/Mfa2 family fimbrial subunit [Paramuribaculum sp.]